MAVTGQATIPTRKSFSFRYTIMFKHLFIPAISTLAFTANSQDVSYTDFSVSQENNVVEIGWTIQVGNLCNGTHILRSVDGSDFVEIAEIEGICGSEVTDEKYGVIDPAPIYNAENTYVLLFGFSQYSEERSVFVGYTDPNQLYVSPNPVESILKLRWNDADHAMYTFHLIDQQGQTVLRQEGISGGTFETDLSTIPAGIYQVVLISDNGRRLMEKIVH
jgi:hypothetical protein